MPIASPRRISIDGPTLTIQLLGIGTFDAKDDIYSVWKEWVKESDNFKYPAAFETVGGNPTTAVQAISPYYFIRNDFGWSLKAAEQDGDQLIEGDLFPFDPSTAFLENSDGNFNSLVRILLSSKSLTNTVTTGGGSGLTAAESAALSDVHGQIERAIYVDPAVSPNGTGYQQSPYNNITDAIDDAEASGVTSLVFLGDVTLDRQLKNFIIRGIGEPTIDVNGQNVDGCEFKNLSLDGTIAPGSSIRTEKCVLRANLTGLRGRFFNSGLDGLVTLDPGAEVTMIDCFSNIGGFGRPAISVNGALNVSVRGFKGGCTVQDVVDQSPQSSVTVSMAMGKLDLAASCTGGVISVRGTSQFTNNAAGSIVDTTGLLNTEELSIAIASLVGNADVNLTDLQVDIKDANLNIVRSLSVSADGRIRRIL